jgi:hypothetical protein
MTGLPEYRNGACVHHRPWGKLASRSRRFVELARSCSYFLLRHLLFLDADADVH